MRNLIFYWGFNVRALSKFGLDELVLKRVDDECMEVIKEMVGAVILSKCTLINALSSLSRQYTKLSSLYLPCKTKNSQLSI